MSKDQKPEKTFQEEITSVTRTHRRSLKVVVSAYTKINSAREAIFERIDKNEDPEVLMFATADLKHHANKLFRHSIRTFKAAKATLEYMEAYVKLGKADSILKNKGYEKITDSSRTVAAHSLKEMLEFKILLAELESYYLSSERLIDNLLADEVDLRQRAKQQVGGF